MSAAFCDIALALGLTFGGNCVPHTVGTPPPLPRDDASAWTLPLPAPKAPPPPPPAMPPVVIEKKVFIERPAPPPAPVAQPAPPPPAPKPDLLRLALQEAWAQPAALPANWADPVIGAGPLTAGGKAPALTVPALDPLGASAPVARKRYDSPGKTSSPPVDNERILAADRYITGILETGINSQVGGDQAGSVIIQVARDVYGYHGRKVLAPKGSRMICAYKPPKDMGSSRLEFVCERILMAGHRAEIRQLSASVGDQQGRQGVTGDVDRRFWERYGTAVLLTGLSTAVRFAAAVKSTDATNTSTAAAEKAAEELSTRFGEITANVLEQTLSLVPIITIPQGTRVQIRPSADWYIADWQQS